MDDDVSSPYYLHHEESPGAVLVSQLLVGDNYPIWSRLMEMALIIKNKIGFVDGSIDKPNMNDSRFGIWLRCNNMVISWILNSISKELVASVIYIGTAKEIWSDLKDRFYRGNGPRIFQLQKAISVISQDQMSVITYFTKLKGLWDELVNYRALLPCSCGAMKVLFEFRQQEYVMKFLMGLDESYSSIRGQILLSDPLPPINKVLPLVLLEEKQREIASAVLPNSDSVAFFSRSNSNNSSSVNRYGGNSANQYIKRDKPVCRHCGITGHTVDKCYKIHGYPPGYKNPKAKSLC